MKHPLAKHPLRLPIMLAAALLAMSGCSSDDGDADGASSAGGDVPASEQADGDAGGAEVKATDEGDCDLLEQSEIEAAFGGALTVTRISGNGERGRGCTVDLAEGEGGQLTFQIGDEANFEFLQEQYSGAGVSYEPVDVGVEGYIVNGAQVIAVNASGDSVSMGLQLFTFGEELPLSEAAIADGVQELAGTALGNV